MTFRLRNIDPDKAYASYRFIEGRKNATALVIVQQHILQQADHLITARRAGLPAPGVAGALYALLAVKRDLRRGYAL